MAFFLKSDTELSDFDMIDHDVIGTGSAEFNTTYSTLPDKILYMQVIFGL
jgi:hypothetical protein